MSIVKNKPAYLKHSKSSFAIVLNETIEAIQDPAALGIYLYLASKPNDWEISATNLKNRFGVGTDFIKKRLSILKKAGLLKSVPVKNAKGQVISWEMVLYNQPQELVDAESEHEIQKVENPPCGKPTHVEDPHITNKRVKQIKEDNKPPIPPKGDCERFEDFWLAYPVKKGKEACRQKWRRLKLDDKADEIISALETQKLNDRAWLGGYIPYPLKYLNQQLWTDEIDMRPSGGTPAQQSANGFHQAMAKYSSKREGYYDEHGHFTENFL